MGIFYSAERRGFFDSKIHRELPADVVRVTATRHRELIDAQTAGARIVPDRNGRPAIDWQQPSEAEMRASILLSIKREAGRRIQAISPDWRQLNDLRSPSPEGAARFAAIDAVRAASAHIEAEAAPMSAQDLAAFDVRTHPLWPERSA